MNEKIKLKEARYFLNRMKLVETIYEEFTFNLSAFLTSARTVMQYMHDEAKTKGKRKWYDAKANSLDVLKFFQITRNLVIHVVPCVLQKDVIVKTSSLEITLSLRPVAVSSEGSIVYGPEVVPSNETQTISVHTYKFDMNWYNQSITKSYTADDKHLCQSICQKYDVLTFCEAYINELDAMMSEGIVKGIITG